MLAPKEKKLEISSGSYVIDKAYEKLSIVELFSEIKKGIGNVSLKENPCLKKEEYILDIKSDGITLTYSCDEGLFRGVTSLWQIIKQNGCSLPCLHIEDEPQLSRRGYMYDIARSRMPKVETFKKIIDVLCMFKYNEFQIYMEGDCFKYSGFPEYTKSFDCLAPEDIKELEDYCSERFIDLVPNQNSFGHLAPWLKYDELKYLGLGDGTNDLNTLNPLLPESFEFIKKLFDSVLPHFKSDYVNIGLDEAYGLGLYQTEEYCKKHGKEKAWLTWMEKINSYVKEKYGKTVMYWADMIVKNRDIYKSLPKDAVALEWGYENQDMGAMGEHCALFRDIGCEFYVCPSCNTHMSLTGRSDVMLSHIRTSAQIGVRNGAKGLLLTEWGTGQGETGHPHFPVWELIPIALAGMYAWNIVDGECEGIGFGVDYVTAAGEILDKAVFKCEGLSKLLFRMGNYYLLEPIRIPVGTMLGGNFWKPMCETKLYNLFDLDSFDTEFFYGNVIDYTKKTISEIEKLSLDDELKAEIMLNSKMVILSAEICKLRGKKNADKAKVSELCEIIDWMIPEYKRLWLSQNYEKGVEVFIEHLKMHKRDLLKMQN
ncbi:MAG: family 20 glycosylhydrolase [Oscillospiraceae bacterium]|nr:family 20 glycosylhydrolase [Oscillospiraceae bacterium]